MCWSSFFLSHRIKSKLRSGTVIATKNAFCIKGKLDTPAVLARVVVHVPFIFADVLARPPKVWCMESWMRSDPDWHNDEVTGMCWVLGREWRDVFSQRGRSEGDVIRVAADWLIHNTTSLISRHFYGHLEKLHKWPSTWNAWDHNNRGVEQYMAEQSRQH